MSIKYTSDETKAAIEQAAKKIASLYTQGLLNWYGMTKKENGKSEYYTEIMSEWLLQNISILQQISSSKVTRNNTYFMDHDAQSRNNQSNREEEKIAMDIWTQNVIPSIGRVLDYQIPLKNNQTDTAGKIDLLSYDDTIPALRILELKQPKNQRETLLRCVLEAYTYSQMVDTNKLIKDAQNHFKKLNIPDNTTIIACPLFFKNSLQWKEFDELKNGGRPYLKALMKTLSIEPIVLSQQYVAEIQQY